MKEIPVDPFKAKTTLGRLRNGQTRSESTTDQMASRVWHAVHIVVRVIERNRTFWTFSPSWLKLYSKSEPVPEGTKKDLPSSPLSSHSRKPSAVTCKMTMVSGGTNRWPYFANWREYRGWDLSWSVRRSWHFPLGFAAGFAVGFAIINVSAVMFARQMWLSQNGGLRPGLQSLIHRSSADSALRPVRISTALNGKIGQWQLHSLSGAQIDFREYCKGKVVFVNFWATWCAPCVFEVGSIAKLRSAVPGVQFLMVTDEDPRTVAKFVAEHDITLPVFVRGAGYPSPIKEVGVPATYILDRESKIVYGGGVNWDSTSAQDFLRSLQAH